MPRNNPIENVFNRFCKDLLGVQKQTTNIGVLLELGVTPMIIYAMKHCIKNYSRIVLLKEANNLVKNTTQNYQTNITSWFCMTKTCIEGTGVEPEVNAINKHILNRMCHIFHQEAFNDFTRDDSKLRTYGKLKRTIGIESYLLSRIKVDCRIAMSKLRISNHELMIEKGRHLKIEKTLRFCPFCPTYVESEKHFLLQCKAYTPIRDILMNNICNILPQFILLSEDEKFVSLLSEKVCIQIVAPYIHNAFQIRKYLNNNHKNSE